MRQKVITTYDFSELSASAQEHALEKLSNINVDYNWWDSTYEDAKEIGLALKESDPDFYCRGHFTESAKDVANMIVNNHGPNCETYKDAADYQAKLLIIQENNPDDSSALDNLEADFLHDLLEDYRILLKDEYEYQTSREAIIDTINANDYQFDLEGNLT